MSTKLAGGKWVVADLAWKHEYLWRISSIALVFAFEIICVRPYLLDKRIFANYMAFTQLNLQWSTFGSLTFKLMLDASTFAMFAVIDVKSCNLLLVSYRRKVFANTWDIPLSTSFSVRQRKPQRNSLALHRIVYRVRIFIRLRRIYSMCIAHSIA